MKFILRITTTYKGYEIVREEWQDTEYERSPKFVDLIDTFQTYKGAEQCFHKLMENISQELFRVVGTSYGSFNRRATDQSVSYVPNDLDILNDFYKGKE